MKIAPYTRINRGDVGGKLPEWYEQVFDPRDTQIDNITDALIKKLNLFDNMNVEKVEEYFEQDTFQEIKLRELSGMPIGILFLQQDNDGYYPNIAWSIVDQGTIKIKFYWSPTPTDKVYCRFVVLGSS